MKFDTKTIHAGVTPDESSGAIMTPIYQTSTYVQERPGEHKGYVYARGHNPTRTSLEANIAALENGNEGICFSSGLAAVDAVLKLLKPGDEIISTSDLYGGSYRQFINIFEKFGIKFHFTPLATPDEIDSYINEKTKMIWVETPSNPMMNIIDIKGICEKVKEKEVYVVTDNTFATPYLQKPLDLGADIVIHSATKYLGGHSDVVSGAVVVNDKELGEQLHFIQNSCGAVPGPQDCFLVLRGIKTLHLRMKQHCVNGRIVAKYLDGHSQVENLYWPGLKGHPNHEVAKKQMYDFGGMLSFTLKGDSLEEAFDIISGLKVFTLAESLGGVESLAGHPASMTHAAIPKEHREKTGVLDSLIRLSVGIEDSEDLIQDLENAISIKETANK
ncbi:MAG: PLP-dependent aspartate aminotransferase family protein [Flavobacteriales bacterium]